MSWWFGQHTSSLGSRLSEQWNIWGALNPWEIGQTQAQRLHHHYWKSWGCQVLFFYCLRRSRSRRKPMLTRKAPWVRIYARMSISSVSSPWCTVLAAYDLRAAFSSWQMLDPRPRTSVSIVAYTVERLHVHFYSSRKRERSRARLGWRGTRPRQLVGRWFHQPWIACIGVTQSEVHYPERNTDHCHPAKPPLPPKWYTAAIK